MIDETGAGRARLGPHNQHARPVSVSAGPSASYHLPFGKYKGSPVSTLPDDYLQWLSTRTLREPLCSVVRRELQTRGQKLEIQTMDARLQEAREQGFFLVQEGQEIEVRAYQRWCVATGAPSICVSLGTTAAIVAISYVGVVEPLAPLSYLWQTLTERWPSYNSQLLRPASIVMVVEPRPIVMEILPELLTMLRTKTAAPLPHAK
jgi:hypothetical protein